MAGAKEMAIIDGYFRQQVEAAAKRAWQGGPAVVGSVVGNDSTQAERESFRRRTLLTFERTIGTPDYLPAEWFLLGAACAHATARVAIYKSGFDGYGTGLAISRWLFITNHHVIDSAQTAATSIAEFCFWKRKGEVLPPVQMMFDPARFFQTSPELDVTVVALAQTWGHRCPLIPESGKALVGEPLNVVQHPLGGPQMIAVRNNLLTDVVGDFLHSTTDTEPGSSGSGVFNDQWQLAAIHHAGVPRMNAAGEPLLRDGRPWPGTRDTIDEIDWIKNESVRVSSVVAWLRSLHLRMPEQALLSEAIARQ